MTVVFVAMLVGIVILFRRRAARKRYLAGLDANRPVFSVAPPGGRLGRLKDGAL